MTDDELLRRIARTLKQEIGPAVDAEYPKTQAFMAAVVLQKLGQQIGLAQRHRDAERADIDALISDLDSALHPRSAPVAVLHAFAEFRQSRNNGALCKLIESLYAARADLGDQRFSALLGRVRQTLRASVDRQVEYAA